MLMSSNTSFLDHQNLHLWRKIGEGSFSKVYLTRYGDIVEDKVTLIATKVINKSRVSEKFVEKFLPRELDILLKLRHPFIVRVSLIIYFTSKFLKEWRGAVTRLLISSYTDHLRISVFNRNFLGKLVEFPVELHADPLRDFKHLNRSQCDSFLEC